LWLVENIEEPGLPDNIKEALNSGDGVYRPWKLNPETKFQLKLMV
jgi:hypothetical protein